MSRLQNGGPISASDINVELRRAWNAPFSLGDGLTRQLRGSGPGQINFSDFWGKQLYVDYGTPLGRYCYSTTLFETYADGNGGSFSNAIEFNSPTCGYNPPPPPPPVNNNPPYGTVLEQFCSSGSLITVFADGNGGSQSSQQFNHPSCGGFEGG